ncbi:glycosyltransferase family 2 protein [Candidatus Pelagibacter sp.]|jgi:glycosyltransferase involved in cell wall biosynthesis|nr:glycosyltransferase family 2 protein [Candidatus Pelagibacter sp.]
MEKKEIKLSIILPCYNESENIPIILEKFSAVMNRSDVEILFVNNGSNDASKDVFINTIPKYFFAKVIDIKVNQGYGFGITSGLREAKGEYIGYMHADMQTDPADPLKALEIIEKQPNPENCFVKGDRKGRSFVDQFFTIGMSLFETIYLNTRLWDINAQPNIFHRSFFEGVKDSCPKDFSLDLYLLYMAKKKKLNIMRFDVIFPDRIFGSSNWNTGIVSKWKFIKRTVQFSTKLKKGL